MNPFVKRTRDTSRQAQVGPFNPNVSSISSIQPHEFEMSDDQINYGGQQSYPTHQTGFHENYVNQVSFPDQNDYSATTDTDYENELTLLQELDIDLGAVKAKLFSAFLFYKPSSIFVTDSDMTGPLILGTIVGLLMAFVD